MAGDPVHGETMVLSASVTAIGTKTQIKGLNRMGKRKSRAVNRVSVFMRLAPYVSRGTKEYGLTLSGLYIPDDPGQQILRDAEAAGTSVFVTVLPDGTNGFMQECLVSNLSLDGNPDAFEDYGFELTGVDEPTVVATGPIP